MKTISVAVSENDYDSFRQAAKRENRPIAQLIREAMAYYRQEKLETKPPLQDLPIFVGHKLVKPLPGRDELYDEMFENDITT